MAQQAHRLPLWVRNAEEWAEFIAIFAKHRDARPLPATVPLDDGTPYALERRVADIRQHEMALPTEQCDELDALEFPWEDTTPRVAVAPTDEVGLAPRSRADHLRLVRSGQIPFDQLQAFDDGPDIELAWMTRGFVVLTKHRLTVAKAASQPDLVVSYRNAGFALGTWACEIERAAAAGRFPKTATDEGLDADIARKVEPVALRIQLGTLDPRLQALFAAMDLDGSALEPFSAGPSRDVRALRDRLRDGTITLAELSALQRTEDDDPCPEWIAGGARALTAASMTVVDALADPDLQVTVTDSGRDAAPVRFALGTWARELATAERHGLLTAALPHLVPDDRRLFSVRNRALLRNLGFVLEFQAQHGNTEIIHTVAVTLADGTSYNLGGWVGDQRILRAQGKLSAEREAALRAFGVRTESHTKDYWWTTAISALDQFIAREGHAQIPVRIIETLPDGREYRLGHWAATQRQRYKLGQMSRSELRQLRARGFDPAKRINTAQRFATGLRALDRYIAEHGHPNAPQGATVRLADGSEFAIGSWLAHKRMTRRAGNLVPSQQVALEERGVVWEPRRDHFAQGVAHFTDFVAREGHGFVPSDHVVRNADGTEFPLGAWVLETRRGLRHQRYDRAAIAELTRAGFVVDAKAAAHDQKLSALDQFVAREGHANVPVSQVEVLADGTQVLLGAWADRIRVRRRMGRAPESRIADLDARGFVWDPFAAKFDHALRFLRQYAEREGRPGEPLRVPGRHIETLPDGESFNLGAWVLGRRGAFLRRGMLPSEADAMFALGCTWADPAKNPQAGRTARDRRQERPVSPAAR